MEDVERFELSFSTPITIRSLEDFLGYTSILERIILVSNNKNYQKEYIRKHYRENTEYYKQKAKKRKESLTREQKLFESIRNRARRNNIPFNIEVDDIVIPSHCPVFNIPFDNSVYYRPSVDRIKPELGYTKGNIAVISYRANWIKTNATLNEIFQLQKWLSSLSS